MMGFAVPVTFSLVFSLMFLMHLDVGRAAACSSDEYEAGRCCLCPAGSHVSKHCTQYAPRSCTSCPDGTYLQAPNKRTDCFTCNNCSAAPGLKVKSPCTSTSNAVCGPSEGFYCVHLTWEGCFQAEKHSSCRPGQYVVKEGTSSTDTVCADCPPSCECIKAGNHSNDSTPEEESHSNHSRCEHMFDVQTPTGVFVVAVALVVLVVGGIVIGGAVCVDVYGVSSSSHDVVAGCIASGVLCYWLFYYTVISGCMGYVSFFNLVCSGVCLGVCVGVLISVVEDTSVFFGGFGAVHGGIITFIIITTRAGNDVVPCIIVLVFIDVVVVVGLVILPLIRRSCQRIRGRRKNDTHEVTEGPSKEDKQLVSTSMEDKDLPDRIQPQDQCTVVGIMENPIPQDQPVSIQPQDQPVSIQPQDQPVSIQPQDQPVSIQPQHQSVSIRPQDQPVSIQPQHQSVSIQPQDQSVSIQPQDQSVSIQPQDQPVSIQPQEKDTLMDMMKEITELKRHIEEKDAKIAQLESRLSHLNNILE